MGLTHLVDSDLLIDTLRRPGRKLASHLRRLAGAMAVSEIGVTGLTYGALRARRLT